MKFLGVILLLLGIGLFFIGVYSSYNNSKRNIEQSMVIDSGVSKWDDCETSVRAGYGKAIGGSAMILGGLIIIRGKRNQTTLL